MPDDVAAQDAGRPHLELRFHGRVIDHLGIQMYQSPVAAVAELIANAWDADAARVEVALPQDGGPLEVVISDDGVGMTLEECQTRFLNVGMDRRAGNPSLKTPKLKRPILGRKGIGKFAGFGIAQRIRVETVSESTGELTCFELDLDRLRGGGPYVEVSPEPIEVLRYEPPDNDRQASHGTIIRLLDLSVERRPSQSTFRTSMARRFLLHRRAAGFEVLVDDAPLPTDPDTEGIEFAFPADYRAAERPAETTVVDGWGVEEVSPGRIVRWRIVFYEEPIAEPELRGVAVFANGKVAQLPFFFNLSGGLGGQHGQQYVSGSVEADFLDEAALDLIATERQRLDWGHPETQPLEAWGKARVQQLLRIWQARRRERKVEALKQKLTPFAERLGKLPSSERRTVERALENLAGIPVLSQAQFVELSSAILTAWEAGRLRELIDELAGAEDMSEGALLSVLVEARVLTMLHTAEAVRVKFDVVEGLRQRIDKRALENDIRDYIADNPWLISPQWETYRRERGLSALLAEIDKETGIDKDEAWSARTDLTLSSGSTLLLVEFMRPGTRVDWDHLNRFERYVRTLRARVQASTGGRFDRVVGYLVADALDRAPVVAGKLQDLSANQMVAMDWRELFDRAAAQWRDFFDVLIEQGRTDERIGTLALPGGADANTSQVPGPSEPSQPTPVAAAVPPRPLGEPG